jgi:phospholipase/carboxylesterase
MSKSHLPAVIIEPQSAHKASVIWLHGLGADGYDFEPVVKAMNMPDHLGIRFILPHAPTLPITANGGYQMPGWYDIYSFDSLSKTDTRGISNSVQSVMKIVKCEIDERGIDRKKIIIAGFSQGGVVALNTATEYCNDLGGAIGLSCYLAPELDVDLKCKKFPIFLAHGSSDPIVPFSLGLDARKQLENAGFDVNWQSYSMDHSVCMEEIMAIRSWLIDHLK